MNRPRQPLPPSADRLASPFEKNRDTDMSVNCKIPQPVYDYLFRGVMAGLRGAQDSLIGTFLSKLHQEIIRECIPTHYDPDNESRVARILSRLNFTDLTTFIRTPDPESLQGLAIDSATRRASSRVKPGGTPRVRDSAPRKTVKPSDVQGGGGGGVGPDRKKGTKTKKQG